jgi:FKBP-type peptidyl-prolyl cis-trans isomerase FkpA
MNRWILFTLLVVGGCASAPAPFAEPTAISYAPALGIDLSKATRSRRGIYILDVREGSGAAATAQSQARVHYSLYLPDGRQVQTTRNGEPLAVRLSDPSFLIGDAIVGMKAGGRRTLVVAPAQGYGREGVPNVVPPNTTIVFDVELVAVTG